MNDKKTIRAKWSKPELDRFGQEVFEADIPNFRLRVYGREGTAFAYVNGAYIAPAPTVYAAKLRAESEAIRLCRRVIDSQEDAPETTEAGR